MDNKKVISVDRSEIKLVLFDVHFCNSNPADLKTQ